LFKQSTNMISVSQLYIYGDWTIIMLTTSEFYASFISSFTFVLLLHNQARKEKCHSLG